MRSAVGPQSAISQKKRRAACSSFFSVSLHVALFAAKQPGVEPELDLVRKELRLISARSAHRLPMQVGHLERKLCLALLEGIEIGERHAAAEAMLGLFG